MALVWTWGIRNLLLVVALAALGAGAAAVVTWGLALAVATPAVVIADIAHHSGRRARARKRRAREAQRALDEAARARDLARHKGVKQRAA